MGRKAKFNEDQVSEIRSSEEGVKALARRFSVDPATIRSVLNFEGAYKRPGTRSNVEGADVERVEQPTGVGKGEAEVRDSQKLFDSVFLLANGDER